MALRSRLKEVMAKLSKKHSEYASLKVDVDREHLPFQIKNKQLEVFFTFVLKNLVLFKELTVYPEHPNKAPLSKSSNSNLPKTMKT